MSGIFFPQRIPLRIDGGSVSPAVLEKKVLAVAYAPSYSIGELVLRKIGGIELTGRGLNKTAVKIGSEMVAQRDARTEAYFNQPLPRQHAQPKTAIGLACVSADGGRMQTRDEGGGKGVHYPHWRETKNALFLRMKSDHFACDPHPGLPACFTDREPMKKLLSGVAESSAATAAEETSAAVVPEKADNKWRPERLYRTCLSSLEDSDAFGRMMEVEADSRGFYHAQKKAFVSDGLPYNWTIQQRHFRDFTPILDFVHAVERLYEAARCVHDDLDRCWEDYVRWASACWLGNIGQVIAELRAHQQRLGSPPEDGAKDDPRKLLADAIGYFQNNASRMDYPNYRRQGLPTTSAHMESLVKEINARVKGTEKFWNDGASGEAILQIRAAALCEDDRLSNFLHSRPGHPFHPNAPRHPSLTTAS
ncbi:MAG: LysR family transcriptional regulator [Planctomycetota bacterium]